jgi:hypothetical protein
MYIKLYVLPLVIELSRGRVNICTNDMGICTPNYMYYLWSSRGIVGTTLMGLTLPHFCACPKPEPLFTNSYGMFLVFLVFFLKSVKVTGNCSFC